MKKALVVGGNSGVGLAMIKKLLDIGYEKVFCVGKDEIKYEDIDCEFEIQIKDYVVFKRVNLIEGNYDFLNEFNDVDTLIYTVGFGRVAEFQSLHDAEVLNAVKVNFYSAMKIIGHFYGKLLDDKPFYCAVMGSIAGHIVSPLFSVYGATKSGLCSFIENLNIELDYNKSPNRILDVSPGSLKGTNFNGTGNNLSEVLPVAEEIINRMLKRETLYIPQYDEVYKGVIERYRENSRQFGIESYRYKLPRVTSKPQVVVGYLSGTFDLFHIGHLNLLKRAKKECDYLIVGVHKSGAWKGKETFIPFDERKEIVANIKYVDEVIESYPEDADAYDVLHYNKLFVGSDYKGSERFNRYEEYFKDKDVEIVYFPYTKGTSSTQLREKLKRK